MAAWVLSWFVALSPWQARAQEATDSSTQSGDLPSGEQANDSTDEPEKEVTVGGQRPHPFRDGEAPELSHSTLERIRLNQPGLSLPEALREAPGVQVTQSGGLGAPATARLRGATGAQTPVYLGRVRINDEVGGVANLSTVPSFFIERVHVYRSHTPRQLTQLGIGGALVLEPRTPQSAESSIQGEVGSFGTRALRGRHAFVSPARRVLVGGELFGADNNYPYSDTRGTLFVDDDGREARLPNADSGGGSVWIASQERVGRTTIDLLLHHATLEQGAPKLALVPTTEARSRFSRSLFAVSSHTENRAGELTLSSRALLGSTRLEDPARELGLVAQTTTTPGVRFEQEAALTQKVGEGWWFAEQVTSSVERLRRSEEQQEGVPSSDASTLSAARFILRPSLAMEYQTAWGLSWGGVFATPCVSTSLEELELCERLEPIGRVHTRWAGRFVETYASVGRAQRLATLSELYGVSLLVRGNDALRPEIATTGEAGARAQIPRKFGPAWAWLDVAAFVRRSSQLIVYLRTAQGFLRPVNRNRARTLGGEFSLGVEPLVGLTLQGNLSLLDPRDVSPERVVENDVLPFLSRAVANLRLSYERGFGDAEFNSARLSFHLFHQSSRFADPAGLGVIPAQTFGDLEVGVKALRRHLEAQLRISNLWNEQRFDVVGFPLPSRSVFANLEVSW